MGLEQGVDGEGVDVELNTGVAVHVGVVDHYGETVVQLSQKSVVAEVRPGG